jgi:hypothetical protein
MERRERSTRKIYGSTGIFVTETRGEVRIAASRLMFRRLR